MFKEMMGQCVEMDEETYPLISRVLEHDNPDPEVEERPAPPVLLVPYEEFRSLVFWLHQFEEMPILQNAWKSAGQPQYFIAQCFGDEYRAQGDMVIIDTQGYEYARYKATVYGIDSV